MTKPHIDARCADSAVHSHDDGKTYCQFGQIFVYRNTFQWARPRLTAYQAADRRRFAVGLNRYRPVVIGAYVQIGHRVVGVTWGRPGAVHRVPVGHP